jgi:hypothetical protein
MTKSSLEAAAQETRFHHPPHLWVFCSFTAAHAGRMLSVMKNRPSLIPTLAHRVCQAIRDVRQEHESWISIDRVHDRLAVEDLRIVDAAVAFASAKGWLALGGQPAHSVSLNQGAP